MVREVMARGYGKKNARVMAQQLYLVLAVLAAGYDEAGDGVPVDCKNETCGGVHGTVNGRALYVSDCPVSSSS